VARCAETVLHALIDDDTRLGGAVGALFGPMRVTVGGQTVELVGSALQQHLRARGADLDVLAPRWGPVRP
jgi:hypothetical protein